MPRTTRAKCTQSGHGGAAAALPEELVVWEILTRLPSKALLRCRAVCRSWRRLTSDSDFLLAHHRRQPSLPLVVFSGQIRSPSGYFGTTLDAFDFWGAALDAFDLWGAPAASAERHPVLRFKAFADHREFKMYASCDGLLLFSLGSHSFYICNPATRQWKALPSLISTNVAGLYRHSSSGEYRILYRRKRYPDLNSACYVLTLTATMGTYAEPRCIGLPVAGVSASIKQYIAAGLLFVSEHPPVLLHSCLHWIVYSSGENALVVFDTVAESFRCMRPPPPENGQWRHLLEMDGTLGISHIDENEMTVKLWVLQAYETEVWSLKYKIELPVVELKSIDNKSIDNKSIDNKSFKGIDNKSIDNKSFKVWVVSEEGDVMVSCSSLCHLFHCDSTGKLLEKFQWHRVYSRPIGHWFKESLVRHAFFQGQDGDHVVQQPFFLGS